MTKREGRHATARTLTGYGCSGIRIAVALAVLFGAALASGAAYAWLADAQGPLENKFAPSEASVEVEENLGRACCLLGRRGWQGGGPDAGAG